MSYQDTFNFKDEPQSEPRGYAYDAHLKIAGRRCFGLLSLISLPAIVALWLLLSDNARHWGKFHTIARRTAGFLKAEVVANRELNDSRSRRCAFGSAPGRWINDTSTPSTWRLLDSECPPLQWLVPSASDDAPPAGCRKPGVLLIGDSTDRMVVEAVCSSTHSSSGNFANLEDVKYMWRSLMCNASTIEIANFPIWGVMPEGPYQEDKKDSASERIPHAFQQFSRHFGRPPQLVVLGSAFWDISAMMLRNKTWLQTHDDLPPELLSQWLQGADAATQKVTESIPQGNPYIWHTQHYPLHKAGKNVHDILGRRAHVTQINAAVRVNCAKHEGCHLVDIESMVAQWFDPEAYLRPKDPIHQNHSLALAVLNMYLNVLSSSRGGSNCTYGQDDF